MDDKQFMLRAIELALLAEEEGNLPVGAVIVLGNKVIAEGRNVIFVPTFDATRHAEMETLRAVPEDLWKSAGEMSLYTSLEPCLMCFSSILLHGVGRVTRPRTPTAVQVVRWAICPPTSSSALETLNGLAR